MLSTQKYFTQIVPQKTKNVSRNVPRKIKNVPQTFKNVPRECSTGI